ncbi:MAG: tRNA dihydrouridine(20/20a) synthase DusA [Proteobacteria bacterium]|nr:tRNA dihydrouridine(20/20a) synthase DusA [Pseudomonadota bacterium]NOG60809.1 tRNA dihydrouridine(20/20a) synthase DusA [Pseudomonadota bacterium]
MVNNTIDRRLSIAPMMDHTDRHFRYFMRLLSKHAVLYTEMITTGALIHGDRQRFLSFNDVEHPLAIQLGGSNPEDLAECAKISENEGYDEVNLNIGCPSDRVQNGQFGACLMSNKNLVADCVDKIQSIISIPVTIKTRIGIDDLDSYDFLYDFINTTRAAGCNTFIIHARKAILSGLSPKENREIPPLNYERVHKIKRDFPDLNITINGGFTELSEIKLQLNHVDGVMVGRTAYQNPFMLAEADNILFENKNPAPLRASILKSYRDYVDKQLLQGERIKNLSRHIIGLYQGQPGARQYRQLLSRATPKDKNNIQFLDDVIEAISYSNTEL